MKLSCSLLVGVAALCCHSAYAASAFTCNAFSAGSQFQSSQAMSINNQGQVVGIAYNPTEKRTVGFLRNADGTVTVLTDPDAGTSGDTLPAVINNNGDIAGIYDQGGNSLAQGLIYGFIRHAGGDFETLALPPLPSGVQSIQQFRISGLNDNGVIAGDFGNGGNQRYLFTRDSNGVYTVTGPYLTIHGGAPTAGPINNAGVELLEYFTIVDAYLSIPGQNQQALFAPAGLSPSLTQTSALNNELFTAGTVLGVGFIRKPDFQHVQTVNCDEYQNYAFTVSGMNDSNVLVGRIASPPLSTSTLAVIATSTGLAPQVELSNPSWDFGVQQQNAPTQSGTVYVTNTGNTFLHIANLPSPALGGQDSQDFAITGTNCTGIIGIQHTCYISFNFTASQPGDRTAEIDLIDDAPDSPHVIKLHGTGAAASLQISNPSWYLGNYPVGQMSASGTIYLYANGTNPVHFSSVTLQGDNASDFVVTANTCGATLGAYRTCSVSFAYTPSAPGFRNAQLVIADDAQSAPQVIPLSGLGY